MDNQNGASGRNRPPRSDADRKTGWAKNLREIGGYTDEAFIAQLCDYAANNRGYDPTKYWGSSLIVMFNRLAKKLRDKIERFTEEDGEYAITKLLEYLQQKPLGGTVTAWRTNFSSNGEQRTALNKFFGCDKPLKNIGPQDRVLLQLRDAAWPSLKEEENNTGGTFAERFHYLATAIARLGTLEGGTAVMWKDCFHDEPLPTFEGYGRGGAPSTGPSWISNGKCKACGSDVTKDEDGNTICANPLCEHNIAAVAVDSPDFGKNFRNGNPQVPAAPSAGKPKGRRDGSDRRHRHDDDGDERFERKHNKNKGPRYHENESEGDELDQGDAPDNTGSGAEAVASAGAAPMATLGDAFAGVGL